MEKITLKEKRILHKPINYVMFYYGSLLALFTLGPLDWKPENPVILYSFLLLAHLLFYLGYYMAIMKIKKKYRVEYDCARTKREVNKSTTIKYLKIFIWINIIFTIMNLIRAIGLSSISFSHIIDSFIKGITDPGTQYSLKFQTDKVFGGGLYPKIITLISPFLWPVIPLSILYFKELSKFYRSLTLFTILIEVARWISIGTNKGVIDIILIILTAIFLKRQQNNCDGIIQKIKFKKKNIRIIIIAALSLYLGLFIFQNNISSRVNNNYSVVSAITNNTQIDLQAPLMYIFPDKLQPLLVYSSQYLTQGYYGLSLTLNEPFIPMFGIGNSYFLIQNFEDLLNVDLWQYTYQARIAYKGWHPLGNWHSAYSWLANDLSYFGVLVLMFIFGVYFANVYYRALVLRDSISIVLFCLLIIACFYVPSNNQILSYPNTFMTFWGMNFLWFVTSKVLRGRRIVVKKNNRYHKQFNE